MKFKIKTKGLFKFVAVIGLLIFLHFVKILAPVENIIMSILNPLAGGIYSISSDLKIVYNEQTDKRDLLEAVKSLEEEVNRLISENVKLQSTKEENEKLRGHLKFISENNLKHILANIISQDLGENKSSIIIDKGLRDGLYAGLGVINSEGIIVGKITASKENISEVLLITDNNCKLAASICEKKSDGYEDEIKKTSGIMSGEMGLTIKMDFIPQTESISEGDIAVTSGLEKNIPRGLAIGRVTKIDRSSNEVWQSATIEPLANLNDLMIVSILLP